MNIVIVSGSPRSNCITCRVAIYLKNTLAANHATELVDMSAWTLPFIQYVFSSEEKTPEEFRPLAKIMQGADAFIFVTPEYNGGYSPAMKNMLDHFPKTTYHRKAIGIVTASDGMFGGMRASQQMQLMICGLFGVPSPQMLITGQVDKKFDEEGKLVDESFSRNLENFENEFLWLAEALHKCRELTAR